MAGARVRRLRVAAAGCALTAGLVVGGAAPAGAIIVIGGTVAIGNPDTSVAVVGEIAPCIAPDILRGLLNPCVVEGDVEVRITTADGR